MAKTKGASEPKVASEFEKIIKEGRERKKNEALAQRIFSKDRRQSAPSKTKLGAGPSLASRVGVKKRASLGPTKPASTGNIHGEWTHDLHKSVNDRGLASRISAPGGKLAPTSATATGAKGRKNDRRAELRADKMASAIERSDLLAKSTTASRGMSIRGLAGPFSVMAQNFAPGTTAADIESAMTPIGGEMVSCDIIKTSPMMVVEMVFVSKEGGEAVVSTFNNKTADGRVIKVFPKPGGYKEPTSTRSQGLQNAPRAPRAQRENGGNIVDGTNGFAEPMETDQYGSSSNGRLYSDSMVGSRRGRGAQRGRGGR